jgi:hypothetical protein
VGVSQRIGGGAVGAGESGDGRPPMTTSAIFFFALACHARER